MKSNTYLNIISNDKVKTSHFHTKKRFIDGLEILNDRGVFNDIYKENYPPELQLKVQHSGIHVTFLNLDITIKDGVLFTNFLIGVMLFLFYCLHTLH